MIGQRVRPALILGRYNIGAPGTVGRHREHPSSTLHPPPVLDGLLRQVPGRAHGEAMRVLRRFLERVVRDPHASDVSCGVCWAWVPVGGFSAHCAAMHDAKVQ